MNSQLIEKVQNALAFILVLAFGIYYWLSLSERLPLVFANEGFTQFFFTHAYLNPEVLLKDFASGTELYANSVVMHIYPLAQMLLEIPPEVTLKAVLLAELAAVALSVALLAKTIFPEIKFATRLALFVICVASYARDINFANFGQPFFYGQFYNFVDAARFVAIGFLFQKKYTAAICLLLLSMTIHPALGATTLLVAMGFILFTARAIPSLKEFIAIFGCGAVTVGWILYHMNFSKVAGGGIPLEEWYSLTAMFNFHWYPLELGYFSIAHTRSLLPMLSMLTLTATFLARSQIAKQKRRDFLVIIGLTVAISCVGVWAAIFKISPILIKLCLHRITDITIVLSVICIVNGLVEDIQRSNYFWRFASLLVLISFFEQKIAYSASLALALSICDYLFSRRFRSKTVANVQLLTMAVLIITTAYFLASGTTIRTDGYLPSLSMIYASLLLAIVIISVPHHIRTPAFHTLFTAIIIVTCGYLWNERRALTTEYVETAKNFRLAQEWAKENTDPKSLFFVAPRLHGGWRDFSQRSSFGSVREWLHDSWLYASSSERYKEGLRRFELFDVNLDQYKTDFPKVGGSQRLAKDLISIFYSWDDSQITKIAREFQINYVVLEKKYLTREVSLPVVYANELFFIIETRLAP